MPLWSFRRPGDDDVESKRLLAEATDHELPSDKINRASNLHSSDDNDPTMADDSNAPPQKRRRVERVTAACDLCKKRKVKCDGVSCDSVAPLSCTSVN